MVFGRQGKSLIENIGWDGLLLDKKGVGLLPGSLSLICAIVAPREKWHLRAIDEGP
jgi:hypothetical protein